MSRINLKILFCRLILWCSIGLFSHQLLGQSELKVMTYNLLNFPTTLYYNDAVSDFMPRTYVLKSIIDDYEPDLLLVCELENIQGANLILNEVLHTEDHKYSCPDFVYNQSSKDRSLQQFIYYNNQKLTLESQHTIHTAIRDINHYEFKLNIYNQAIYLDVFVAHLKAGGGSNNENKRLKMVKKLTEYLENIPTDHYVIFGGDFNLYDADEPAYQNLLSTNNAIILKDPIDRYGNWHNNADFQDIHTQSPLTYNGGFQDNSGDTDGATGGMDDRFDFILVSENLLNSSDLYYVDGTYHAYGNNGNCFNDNINDVSCNGDFYSQELRDQLANMSDHLPVVMTLQTPQTLSVEGILSTSKLRFISPNRSQKELLLVASEDLLGHTLVIYNQMGQNIKEFTIAHQNISLDISGMSQGVYWLTVKGIQDSHLPLKFIKN